MLNKEDKQFIQTTVIRAVTSAIKDNNAMLIGFMHEHFLSKKDAENFVTKVEFKSEIGSLKQMFLELRLELNTEHEIRYQKVLELDKRVTALEYSRNSD